MADLVHTIGLLETQQKLILKQMELTTKVIDELKRIIPTEDAETVGADASQAQIQTAFNELGERQEVLGQTPENLETTERFEPLQALKVLKERDDDLHARLKEIQESDAFKQCKDVHQKGILEQLVKTLDLIQPRLNDLQQESVDTQREPQNDKVIMERLVLLKESGLLQYLQKVKDMGFMLFLSKLVTKVEEAHKIAWENRNALKEVCDKVSQRTDAELNEMKTSSLTEILSTPSFKKLVEDIVKKVVDRIVDETEQDTSQTTALDSRRQEASAPRQRLSRPSSIDSLSEISSILQSPAAATPEVPLSLENSPRSPAQGPSQDRRRYTGSWTDEDRDPTRGLGARPKQPAKQRQQEPVATSPRDDFNQAFLIEEVTPPPISLKPAPIPLKPALIPLKPAPISLKPAPIPSTPPPIPSKPPPIPSTPPPIPPRRPVQHPPSPQEEERFQNLEESEQRGRDRARPLSTLDLPSPLSAPSGYQLVMSTRSLDRVTKAEGKRTSAIFRGMRDSIQRLQSGYARTAPTLGDLPADHRLKHEINQELGQYSKSGRAERMSERLKRQQQQEKEKQEKEKQEEEKQEEQQQPVAQAMGVELQQMPEQPQPTQWAPRQPSTAREQSSWGGWQPSPTQGQTSPAPWKPTPARRLTSPARLQPSPRQLQPSCSSYQGPRGGPPCQAVPDVPPEVLNLQEQCDREGDVIVNVVVNVVDDIIDDVVGDIASDVSVGIVDDVADGVVDDVVKNVDDVDDVVKDVDIIPDVMETTV